MSPRLAHAIHAHRPHACAMGGGLADADVCVQAELASLECGPALLPLLECGDVEGHTLALDLLQSLDDVVPPVPSQTLEGSAGGSSSGEGGSSPSPLHVPEQILAK